MCLTGSTGERVSIMAVHGTIKKAYGRCAFLLFCFHHASTHSFFFLFFREVRCMPDRPWIDI
jgi:hypothetical protein